MRLDMSVNTWRAIVPFRGHQDAKSRFSDFPFSGATLAWAMMEDLLTALRQATSVHNVTVVTSISTQEFGERFPDTTCIQEPADIGLNAAIALVADQPMQNCTGGTMVLLGDLPCIRPTDIDHLGAMELSQPSFIPDAAGTGTTLWCAPKSFPVQTHFGRHSRAAHKAAGCIELGGAITSDPWPRLRRDVDTKVDLWDAHRIGVGPATRAIIAQHFPALK